MSRAVSSISAVSLLVAVFFLVFAVIIHLDQRSILSSTGMLLVPAIGVVSASFILSEPLGWRELAAMVLTLGGVTLALQRS